MRSRVRVSQRPPFFCPYGIINLTMMPSSFLPNFPSIRGLRKVYLPPKFSVEKSFSYLSRHIPGHFPPKFSVSWGRDLSVFWTQEWDLRWFSISSHDFKISAYSRFLIFAGSKTTLTSKQREEAALISEKPGVDRLETSTSYLVNYSKNGIIIGIDARCHKLPNQQNGIRKRRIALLEHLCDEFGLMTKPEKVSSKFLGIHWQKDRDCGFWMMNESDRFLRLIFRQMSAILCTTPTEESCHAEDDAARFDPEFK